MPKIKSKSSLKPDQINTIKKICQSFENHPGELINVLHKTQETFGYLPKDIQEEISRNLKVSSGRVYGVVSFYSFFTMKPKGMHPIDVCTGTACYVRGAEKVVEEFKRQLQLEVGETSSDGKFSINSLRCVGACGLAPVVLIGEKVYGRVTPAGVKDIIKEYQ